MDDVKTVKIEEGRGGMGKRREVSDSAILDMYRKHLECAITETAEKYGKLCYSVAYSILGSHEDSEVCVNDTYVRAWKSVAFDAPDNLGAYLCRITRNLAVDRYRKSQARAKTAADAIEELEALVSDVSGDVMTDRIAMTHALNRFLTSLSPRNRMIFMRRYFYMNSTKEIAKMLTTTDGTIRITLHSLRRKLKKYLEKEGIET